MNNPRPLNFRLKVSAGFDTTNTIYIMGATLTHTKHREPGQEAIDYMSSDFITIEDCTGRKRIVSDETTLRLILGRLREHSYLDLEELA